MPLSPVCTQNGTMLDVQGEDHLGPPASHVAVWLMVGAIGLLIARAIQQRSTEARRAIEADATVDADAPLVAGARFITGRVEFAEGSDLAVEVHVVQKGVEAQGKHGWSHTWSEQSRKVHSAPFYVRCKNEDRVRVEPGAHVLLVDDPDRMIWTEKTKRTRIAVLTPGEYVVVEGHLIRGQDPEARQSDTYRGGKQGWIMHPPPGEMMHISAEDLGDRHRIRSEEYRKAARALWFVFAFVNLLFVFYHVSVVFGTDTCASVVTKDVHSTKDSKGRVSTYHRVTLDVEAPIPLRVVRNVDSSDWGNFKRDAIVAFRNVPAWESASMLGRGTSVSGVSVGFAFVGLLIGAGIYGVAARKRRWYEGRLEDQGNGRLLDAPVGPTTPPPKKKRRKKNKSANDDSAS